MDENERIERYIGGVLRHLYLKNEYRRRVVEDLPAHIAEAAGTKPVDEGLKDMGHPRKVATEIMETYGDDYEKMGFLNAVAYAQRVRDFSAKSPTRVGSWPLVHIATGYNESGERNVAKGIIAVGDIAIGVVAPAVVSLGVVAMGALVLRETGPAYEGRSGTRVFSAAGTTLASVSSTPGCSPSCPT